MFYAKKQNAELEIIRKFTSIFISQLKTKTEVESKTYGNSVYKR